MSFVCFKSNRYSTFVQIDILSLSFFRRTGKDIKAGKVIRKMPGGFENFDDYWSESGQQSTLLLLKNFYIEFST